MCSGGNTYSILILQFFAVNA